MVKQTAEIIRLTEEFMNKALLEGWTAEHIQATLDNARNGDKRHFVKTLKLAFCDEYDAIDDMDY